MTDRAKRIREKLTNIETWNPFCHGTSSKFVPDIEKWGLQPRQCFTEEGILACRSSVYAGKTFQAEELESRPDRVYVARVSTFLGTCMQSARNAKDTFGGESRVLGVALSKDSEPLLEADEDAELWIKDGIPTNRCKDVLHDVCEFGGDIFHYAPGEHFPKRLTEEVLESTREQGCFTEDEIDEVCSDLPMWTLSLLAWGTVAHKGPVPSEQLSTPVPLESLYSGPTEEEKQRSAEAIGRLATPRRRRHYV